MFTVKINNCGSFDQAFISKNKWEVLGKEKFVSLVVVTQSHARDFIFQHENMTRLHQNQLKHPSILVVLDVLFGILS